jgi:hypothetical protein
MEDVHRGSLDASRCWNMALALKDDHHDEEMAGGANDPCDYRVRPYDCLGWT